MIIKRLKIPPSTFYDSLKHPDVGPGPTKRAKGPVNPEEDAFIRNYISIKRSQKFFEREGGYRKLSLYCRREMGIICNHKRMYRLCMEEGVLLPRKKKKIRLRRLSVDREITAPNKLWQFDIKYGFVHGENNFFFVCAFIDVFDRGIRGYHIGRHCKAEDILRTLCLALKNNRIGPEDHLVIRSDNGPQMTSKKFEKELENLPADHEFIPIRTPNKNAYIESFFSLLEINVMSSEYFYSFREAFSRVVEFVNFYQNERIHGSLKMPPAEFRRAWESNLYRDYAVRA